MNIIKGQNVIIKENVKIGREVIVGNNVVIYGDTVIGDNVRIEDNAIIGRLPVRAKNSATTKIGGALSGLKIGKNCIIGSGTVIYRGANIGEDVFVADNVSVREEVKIGDNTIIGRNSTIENKVVIGKNCKIQSNVQLVPYSVIEDFVFISPGVMTSNDNYIGRTKKRFSEFRGITVRKGARLGVGAVILPGVVINRDALVAAGAVVTKNVPAKKIVMGVPAREVGDVDKEQLLINQ